MAQGGAEKLLFDLVSHEQSDLEMNVVTILADEAFFRLEPPCMRSLGLRRGRIPLSAAFRLRAAVRNFDPDLIQAWLYHGNLFSVFAANLGAPIVWSIHNTALSPTHSKPLTRLANRLCAPMSRFIPARIVYCASSARRLHEQLGYHPGRGLVIENGVDTDRFDFDPLARRRLREALDLREQDYAIGCIARFEPQKNHAMVIEALSRVAARLPAQLVLVGRGCTADNGPLGAMLAKFGVRERVKLLGERHDIPAILSALDVLAIGSTYGEALPIVAIEAAAVGVPIVTTDLGDVRLLALDSGDVLASPSAAAMAAAILKVRAREGTPGLAAKKAERRSTVVREFSIGRTIERYYELYRSVARAR